MRWRPLVAALLLAAPAQAHSGHDALTLVVIDKVGAVTVTHRFEASDIEPALAEIAPAAQPSLDDPQAVAALVAYAGRNFALAGPRGPIALTPGKHDIGASEVRLVFTGRTAAPLTSLVVTSGLLHDIYGKQVNQVMVRRGKYAATLIFRAAGSQTLKLP